jgi:hypothetical protein
MQTGDWRSFVCTPFFLGSSLAADAHTRVRMSESANENREYLLSLKATVSASAI